MRKLLFLCHFFFYYRDGAAECSSEDVADSVERRLQEIEYYSYHTIDYKRLKKDHTIL